MKTEPTPLRLRRTLIASAPARSGCSTIRSPRRPDRPADYDAYVYPIPPGLPGGHSVISGYDLDRPDPRRSGVVARCMRSVTEAWICRKNAGCRSPMAMIAASTTSRATPRSSLRAPLFGTTVVTRHTLREEGGGLRDYILLFGHLDAVAPGLEKGGVVHVGDIVGTVGDTGSPELIHSAPRGATRSRRCGRRQAPSICPART